jgi:hypothetical protein
LEKAAFERHNAACVSSRALHAAAWDVRFRREPFVLPA